MNDERASSPVNLNDLFDYDVGLDEIFQDNHASNGHEAKPSGDPSTLGLGLDDEVKVSKKRQPVAKLDEGRLLSPSGISKLRRTARQKLRFKGKGHEFSDAARLLNFYQLWLDELFPRAKFADGLAMVEKLGHSKRIQTMRREWIEEEKPKPVGDHEISRQIADTIDLPTRISSDPIDAAASGPKESFGSKPWKTVSAAADPELFISDPTGESRSLASYPEPDDDDLEDLLREQDPIMPGMSEPTSRPANNNQDDFDAEYEAMNEMGL